MATNYSQQVYLPQKEESEQFQDYLCEELNKRGFILQNYTSKRYQMQVGENVQGMEIKRDGKFRTTGNLYIEESEKSDPSNAKYVQSGIWRNDNTWLFGIGDEYEFFIFTVKTLRRLATWARNNKEFALKHGIRFPDETGTSTGYLISVGSAMTWCERHFVFKEYGHSQDEMEWEDD